MDVQSLVVGVVAVDEEWGIGKGNAMPWYNKADFKWFKAATEGNSVVMGNNTWDSLPVKPLPKRKNYVLTGGKEPLGASKATGTIKGMEGDIKCVIGGLGAFKHYIDEIDIFLISRIKGKHDCDVFFDKDLLDGFSFWKRISLGQGEDEFTVDVMIRDGKVSLEGIIYINALSLYAKSF
ncbi:dihydrofolate reductase (plasmid) [Enterobacter hormaechei]|uniref:dihydrofolate reductase n=1 Tax=Enterobacter cloacae TaxID=550 RepID=A0A2L1KMS9_ENTCL|nr:Dihydrofolate reductase [Enterobacter cloacae]AVE23817.1 Dihydrofolate reductase [Enterobacter cloacae]